MYRHTILAGESVSTFTLGNFYASIMQHELSECVCNFIYWQADSSIVIVLVIFEGNLRILYST